MDRGTDRQTDRQRDRQVIRETDRQTDRHVMWATTKWWNAMVFFLLKMAQVFVVKRVVKWFNISIYNSYLIISCELTQPIRPGLSSQKYLRSKFPMRGLSSLPMKKSYSGFPTESREGLRLRVFRVTLRVVRVKLRVDIWSGLEVCWYTKTSNTKMYIL